MTTNTNNSNTALQVTNFDFYGDSLIALQDNATGEIYTSITHVLRGIGFTEKQIEHQKKKFLNDEIVNKGIQKFSGVDLHMPSVNEITCISNRKLPLALVKINITPKMKQTQPELVSKLELYQDKCADVLASVFIDHKMQSLNLQPLTDTLSSITNTITILTQTMTTMQQEISNIKEQSTNQPKQLPKKKFSYWSTKMFSKYQLLTDYFNISNREL